MKITDQTFQFQRIISLSLALILIVGVCLGSLIVVEEVSVEGLQTGLARGIPLLLISLFLILVLSALCLGRFWLEIAGKLSGKSRLILLSLLLFGFYLSCFVVPRTNRIFFDEHIYQNIAQTITHTGSAYMVNEGRAELSTYDVYQKAYNKQPVGYPVYLSILFHLFGVSESTAHFANNLAFLLSLLSIFGISLLLFQKEKTALLSVLFYILTPMALIWSNTAAVEPSAAAFSALAILSVLVLIEKTSLSAIVFF